MRTSTFGFVMAAVLSPFALAQALRVVYEPTLGLGVHLVLFSVVVFAMGLLCGAAYTARKEGD